MSERVVDKRSLRGFDEVREKLAYWRTRPMEERVAAAGFLRRQFYGTSPRFQRSARVLDRARG